MAAAATSRQSLGRGSLWLRHRRARTAALAVLVAAAFAHYVLPAHRGRRSDPEAFDLQRTNARNRAVGAQHQKQPGAKHFRGRDVLDGQHVEPVLGGVRASQCQSERTADKRAR
jgi:hypothetical protein